MDSIFTAIFLAALGLTTSVRLWLAQRHLGHIAAHRGAVPPEFVESITLAAHQKAADYTSARVRVGMLETITGAVFLLALTLGGVLQGIYSFWAGIWDEGGYAQSVAFIASVGVLSFLVDLPFSLYRVFVIEERFGFNKLTWRLFVTDLLKEGLLGVVIGLPVVLAVLWLMNRMGQFWWFYVWLFWLGFNLLVLLIFPTFIAPLFNKFTPLADDNLKARIEQLLRRCGFRSSGLFVMDGSRRSAHGNAYFTGFGASTLR